MSEGRKTEIVLIDGRKFGMLIQPKLHVGELLDLAASHFSLKEKEYFGLHFIDSFGQSHWLQLDRCVLDHSFLKSAGPLVLYLVVRFFVESISYLKDNATVELFYLQARQAILEGKIDCDGSSTFTLAAFGLQATNGSYVDEETAKMHLKNLLVLPMATLREFPSISYCEDRILTIYRNLKGSSKTSSIASYMSIVERLPMYGIHYYEVKDRSGLPWWLGIGYKGISLFDFNDKNVPRRVFPWNQLENLYFRDRKFSVEVHDVKRASVTRRALFLSNVNVHSWTSESGQQTKAIWTMAIAQHQFYLDCKKSKLAAKRTVHETAIDSTGVGKSRKSKCGHHARSMSACISDADFVPPISGKAAKMELCDALRDRKKALEEKLQAKLNSLREIYLKEAAITGRWADDAPDDLRESAVTLPADDATFANSSINEDRNLLESLEDDFKMQKRITCAHQKLVDDLLVDQDVHKSRQKSLLKALSKLKDLEKKLQYQRQLTGKPLLRNERQRCTVKVPSACSSPDLTAAFANRDAGHRIKSKTSGFPSVQSQSQDLFPCSKFNRRSTVDPATSADLPYPSRLDCRPMNAASVHNMALYNIRTHQTTNYDSSSDLNLPLAPGCDDRCPSGWPSKHASLEGAYKRGTRASSGSVHLDRNLSSGCLECHELFADGGLRLGPSSLSSFSDRAGEKEKNVQTFQNQPKMKDCFRTASSFPYSASSNEVFSNCSCAAKEHSCRHSCDMKVGHCSCCPYAPRENSTCCSHVKGKCTGYHCLRGDCSNPCSNQQVMSSQAPKIKRRNMSPFSTRHYSSREDSSSACWGDKAIVLNSHQLSDHPRFSNKSQTVQNSDNCSSHRHSTNSGSNAALLRSFSVSCDRTSKRDSIPAGGSGLPKPIMSSSRVMSSSRDVGVNCRKVESSHHARSRSVHVASDFSCTGLSEPTSLCVGSKLQGSTAS